MDFAPLWCLDPAVTYLNHGSFGACPSAVLEAQADAAPRNGARAGRLLGGRICPPASTRRGTPCPTFLGAEPPDVVFVPNATAGVNAVLRSLSFGPGDELLLTNHTYAACRKTVDFVAQRCGARVVVANLPFPCRDEEDHRRGSATAGVAAHTARAARPCHQPHRADSAARAPGERAARARRRYAGGRRARSRHGAGRPVAIWVRRTTPAMPISGCAPRRERRSCTCVAIGSRVCIRM